MCAPRGSVVVCRRAGGVRRTPDVKKEVLELDRKSARPRGVGAHASRTPNFPDSNFHFILNTHLSDQVRRGGVVQYVPSTRTGPRRTVRTSTRVCMKRRRGDIGSPGDRREAIWDYGDT